MDQRPDPEFSLPVRILRWMRHLTHAELCILLYLFFAGGPETEGWVSCPDVAAQIGLLPVTTERALRRMERKGLVVIERRAGGRQCIVNRRWEPEEAA